MIAPISFARAWVEVIKAIQTSGVRVVTFNTAPRTNTSLSIVRSLDGTSIAYERLAGDGPPVIFVMGAFNDRSTGEPLARYLPSQFSVVIYDRRGRGDSGDTPPYAIEREIEDLDALIHEAGGSAAVFGFSSGALLAAKAAARGLAISKLAVYDPPYMVANSRPRPAVDHAVHLAELVASGRRGEAVEYFQAELVGIPRDIVAQLRHAPFRPALEATAHTLVYETLITNDQALPGEVGSISVPTLVMVGEASAPELQSGAQSLARAIPHAELRSLPGMTHDLVPDRIAPELEAFFR
jgi:pimeloyl-ACP methyl ester carboxylesterase